MVRDRGRALSPLPGDVLRFWFADLDADGRWDRDHARRWFRGEPSFDALARARFGEALVGLREGAAWAERWRETTRGRLALILLGDQIARNVYRGQAEAFALDPLALALALELVDSGAHLELHPIEQLFAYLPLEHTEDLATIDVCVGLLVDLATRAPAADHGYFRQFVRYALKHREVVARFGRYPHRNAALGRASTSEELDYLRDGGETFGFTALGGSSAGDRG